MSYNSASDRAKRIDGYVPFPDDRVERYVERGYWSNRRFHDIVDEHASTDGDALAVVDPHRKLTYDELARRSKRLASFFHAELGLEPLDRVVFHLPNRAEFLEAFFACSRAGTIPVMLLPRHRRAEASHILEVTDAKAYLTIDADSGFDYVGAVEEIADEHPSLEHRIAVTDDGDGLPGGWHAFGDVTDRTGYEDTVGDIDRIDINPCDPGLFLLSGGTTGFPKAIPRTHNDYVFQWRHMALEMGVEADWTGFASVPAAHNASLIAVIGPTIWRGGTVALEPVLKPEPLMALVERVGGSFSLPIPTQLIDILDHPRRDEYDLSSLELLISGGQKVPPQVVRRCVEEWGVEFGNVFGMAEGPLIITRPGDDVELQATTVGYPVHPDADEVRLVDLADRSREVPVGERGELTVRGPGYFTGYFRNEEENAQNFDEDGWFYTEDVLLRREDGYYEVHGRIKDTIIRGGENIYTPGVEDRLIEHPKIENVAVVGKPDGRLGERPFAYVSLVDDADEVTVEELSRWLDDRGIAVFKHPEFVKIVDSFPRTEVEKIDKQTLRERVREE